MKVDCVIVDEAGQISLGSISLVLRSLSEKGRIIIAGDSEQLAPILSAQYPILRRHALFGSVLDCLMSSQPSVGSGVGEGVRPPSPSAGDDLEPSSSQGTIVQLTENFRYAACFMFFFSNSLRLNGLLTASIQTWGSLFPRFIPDNSNRRRYKHAS